MPADANRGPKAKPEGRTGMELTDIDYLGLDRVLKRGTGDIIEERARALLIRDRVSDAWLLGCEDPALGAAILERHLDSRCRLLMVSDHGLGQGVYRRYGFTELLECYQTAYYGPAPIPSGRLVIEQAEKADLPRLVAAYDLVSPEDLERIVARKKLLLGRADGRLVGFIGEHLEGSMGLLYVFPEYRRLGVALELERAMIARTQEAGFVPFGQVEKQNRASLALQRKLGMTVSSRLICWMWR